MIGWRRGHWPFRKGGTILPTAPPARGTVSFEQVVRALKWVVSPWNSQR